MVHVTLTLGQLAHVLPEMTMKSQLPVHPGLCPPAHLEVAIIVGQTPLCPTSMVALMVLDSGSFFHPSSVHNLMGTSSTLLCKIHGREGSLLLAIEIRILSKQPLNLKP